MEFVLTSEVRTRKNSIKFFKSAFLDKIGTSIYIIYLNHHVTFNLMKFWNWIEWYFRFLWLKKKLNTNAVGTYSMESQSKEKVPSMEHFLIYQTEYYIKLEIIGINSLKSSLVWQQFFWKIIIFVYFALYF